MCIDCGYHTQHKPNHLQVSARQSISLTPRDTRVPSNHFMPVTDEFGQHIDFS